MPDLNFNPSPTADLESVWTSGLEEAERILDDVPLEVLEAAFEALTLQQEAA